MMPATNKPIAVTTQPIGPVINLIAKPNPRVAKAAALLVTIHIFVATVASLAPMPKPPNAALAKAN